jgi:hypothetical protein
MTGSSKSGYNIYYKVELAAAGKREDAMPAGFAQAVFSVLTIRTGFVSLFFIIAPHSDSPTFAHDMLERPLEIIQFLADMPFSIFCRAIQFGFS